MDSTSKLKTLFQCIDMHGININVSSLSKSLEEVESLILERRKGYVVFFDANLFHHALCDEKVRDTINRAALIYPDGIAPKICASLCSGKHVGRVSGPTFFLKACQYGIERNWRHFLLGGKEGVADKLAEKLKRDFPGIQIAGTYCPPFRALTDDEEKYIKRQIEESHTDLLWVALGGPKQEFWMAMHSGKIDVPVMLGVGAAFDFHTGNRPWAPKIIRKLGMEWFWRMLSGGWTTFVRNLKCVLHIFLVLAKDVVRYKIFCCKKHALYAKTPTESDVKQREKTAFDFHAGNHPWAPKIFRKLGMEWFWRMLSIGWSIFVRNLKCALHIFLALANKIFRRKKHALSAKTPAESDEKQGENAV